MPGTLASLLIKLGFDATGVEQGAGMATRATGALIGGGLGLAAKGALEMEDRAARSRPTRAHRRRRRATSLTK